MTQVAKLRRTGVTHPQEVEGGRLVFTRGACDEPPVRRIVKAVLLIAYLQRAALASPDAGPTPPLATYDADGAVVATASIPDTESLGSPWLDLAPASVLSVRSDQPARRSGLRDPRIASALTLGGLYAGFMTWTYFAWYRKPGHAFRAGGDGSWKPWADDSWFGATQYAGGADKMGHAWATLALARAGTEILHQWGGYSRLTSALTGSLLSEALFLGVEIKDGFLYQFSYGDLAFNTLGAALAFAQSMWPRVDELVDFRVQYVPSARYRDKFVDGDVDVAEDYSGQTYQLALHLGALRPLREATRGLSAYVDVMVGFEARGYKPDPPYKIDPTDPARQDYAKRQSTFVGVSLNAQGVFDRLLRGRSEPLRRFAHGTLEVFAIPYTSLPVLSHDVRTAAFVPDEQ